MELIPNYYLKHFLLFLSSDVSEPVYEANIGFPISDSSTFKIYSPDSFFLF